MDNSIFQDTYEIVSLLGHGGMSSVYLAEHRRLHTKWAVKEVRKQQGVQFDFLAESNILKRLRHPMLPRIVDIFEDSACIYIVEDYVEGITLEELLRQQQRVDESLAYQWYQDLCGVLHYLHGQQPPIIYRDMKPSNIMLQPDGSLKLIDFGIAREYNQESNADTTYVGTKGYAAPEQFGKAQTDDRTDIYGLGVTMYHLLSGKSPYEPPYQFVPLRQLVPGLSAGIEYIVGKCIQPEPGDRYQSVDELLDDLEHIYRFDRAWKRFKRRKAARVILIVLMLAASAALIYTGRNLMARETEDRYSALLAEAGGLYTSDYNRMAELLDEARSLFPDRVDADRAQTYALYLNGRWQDCVNFGSAALKNYGEDTEIRLSMASAQFELGDYKAAAEGFAKGGELSQDNMRDYAVCLGRLGESEKAEQIMNELIAQGSGSIDTLYVQGEIQYVEKEYTQAETSFLSALEQSDSDELTRRCYISLGDLYRDCAVLAHVGGSPIDRPASKSAALLSNAVVQEGMRYDSTLWETLALAYYEAFHTDTDVPADYLTRSAECFRRVIELGVTKEYLYTNLYTIYYELGDYEQAEQTLLACEAMFPESYMPHAFRGMMLITIENQKEQNKRDYTAALVEYETAGTLIRSSDVTTYYQQLGSLIEELRRNGWLS